MRIAVMGAGGLGTYIGGRLAAAGEEVAFIGKGAHLAAMRVSGIRIESPFGDLHLPMVKARATPAEVGAVDLVLFTVKLWDTDVAAAELTPLIASNTRVLTLQNGVDSVNLIARHVAPKQVVAGLTYIPAAVREPGVIRNPGGSQSLVVDNNRGNAVVASFKAACGRAIGLDTVLTDAIGTALWEKYIVMSALAAASSLMRSTAGPIFANREARAFVRQLLEDGIAVAAATGNGVREGFADETLEFYDTLPPTLRSSMAEDLERGRRLELPWLSGRIHALGLQHGILTPAHTAAFRALILYSDGRPG